MVKTRLQQATSEVADQRNRSIPPSVMPPKVCCTPPNSVKKQSALSTAQNRSHKKKRLMFAPDPPQEFKFDFKSPPARRMFSANYHLAHDSVVRLELEAREGDDKVPFQIGEKERERCQMLVIKELKDELKLKHGIDCDAINDNERGFEDRIRLAETLRRRAEIRRNPMFEIMPHHMDLKEIQKELHQRRISFSNLSHFQASEALERALLKEDAEGLVGEGYQFGRRLVSAEDLITYQQPSDKGLRSMLQDRLDPSSAIPRTKKEKLELLSKKIEEEQEQLMRKLVLQELEFDLQRRKIPCESKDYSNMFEVLYQSGKWNAPYEDVDNTSFDPTQASCTVQ